LFPLYLLSLGPNVVDQQNYGGTVTPEGILSDRLQRSITINHSQSAQKPRIDAATAKVAFPCFAHITRLDFKPAKQIKCCKGVGGF
jgi:hypothetical protein